MKKYVLSLVVLVALLGCGSSSGKILPLFSQTNSSMANKVLQKVNFYYKFEIYEKNGRIFLHKNDKPVNGIVVAYYDKSKIGLIKEVKNGYLHGKGLGFYPNSQIKFKHNYFMGVKDVDNINYLLNGSFLRQIYEKGFLQKERYFDKYKNPISDISKTYYNNGKLKSIRDIKYGYLNGDVKIFYSNGNIKFEKTFKNGILNGDFNNYYPNGRVCFNAKYIDGDVVFVRYFDKNGGHKNINFKTYYPNGKLEKEYVFDKNGYLIKGINYYVTGDIAIKTIVKNGIYYNYKFDSNKKLIYKASYKNNKLLKKEKK